jgi:hypothetical protein
MTLSVTLKEPNYLIIYFVEAAILLEYSMNYDVMSPANKGQK